MDITKRKSLEARGWKEGTVEEFLGLTPAEAELVELKLALSQYVKMLRVDQSITQVSLAQLIGSSQSRVAKIEAGDPSVSMDLLVGSLFALGVSNKDLADIVSSAEPPSIPSVSGP